MKRKPLFRFLGRPQGGVRQQFDAARLVQDLYFRLVGEDGLPVGHQVRAHHEVIEMLREKLSTAGVAVSEPAWFAALVQK